MIRKSLFTLLFLFATPWTTAQDTDWEQLLKSQLAEAELDTHQRFAFSQSTNNQDNERQVASFTPKREPQWQLISVDDRAPTDKEQSKFLKERERASERRGEDRFADLITPGTVAVADVTDSRILLTFAPYLKDMSAADSQAFMRGEAEVDPQTLRLLSLRIFSIDEFSPSFGVSIARLTIQFEFATFLGQTLPAHYLFSFQGKVAGMKKIDVESSIRYGDYKAVDG
ncbi:hypothetical protein [Reinekea sp. G2M2-21]|uniref:hypothetical protein n=1 Tax=Reinekea sp. G2M2-21 TaxID=2788942 RepID=UPI0018AAB3EC|nr:hypothetical protein [Reinekea sp. G2M2-21]